MQTVDQILMAGVPDSVSAAEARLATFTRDCGFDHFAYIGGRAFNASRGGHDIWAQPPTILIDYPQGWVEVYHQEDFGRVDPALTNMFQRRLPFVWDAEAMGRTVDKEQRNFLLAAHDFKLSRGLTIPVYGPGGDFAMFSYVSQADPREFAKVVGEHGHTLHLLSLYYHQAISRVTRAEQEETALLSIREREVLHWAAAGKTFEEAGIILGISRKTVEAHMYKAMRKLDVYNTPQAVTKAILLGLIQP